MKFQELAIIKVVDRNVQSTMIKLKFTQKLAILDITNSGLGTIIFDLKVMLGILDLRSLGHYKIKPGISQQNLSKYYRLKSADVLCDQCNKFINTLKKERKEETKNICCWILVMKGNICQRNITKIHRFRKIVFNI